MHILQPNHLPADRALLKVFPQTISIWGEFGREDRFGQLFEKSQGGMEEREEWEPACFQLSTAVTPALQTHLNGGWNPRRESGAAASRAGESGDFRRTIAPGRSGASGAAPQLTYPPRGR